MSSAPHTPLGAALEQALQVAATDSAFGEAFRKSPLEAVRSLGLCPSPAEEALLLALGPEQVGPLLDALGRRAAAVAATAPAPPPPGLAPLDPAGGLPERLACQGIRPDQPVPPCLGIRPDQPSPVRGIQPDMPPLIKGIRPGRAALAAAATATIIGGGALYLSVRSRPERPATEARPEAGPRTEPRDGATGQDAGPSQNAGPSKDAGPSRDASKPGDR
ncbi:MAG: hypothetical protein RBU30_15440 [Polyangia bacterium]|jgi:hypothetical protein|nr:hypothetical protein [Polyangia bacterium]